LQIHADLLLPVMISEILFFLLQFDFYTTAFKETY